LKGRRFKVQRGGLANAQVCLGIASLRCTGFLPPQEQVNVNVQVFYFVTVIILIMSEEELILYFENVKKSSPDDWELWEHLGYVYRAIKNYKESIGHYGVYVRNIKKKDAVERVTKIQGAVINEAWGYGLEQVKLKNYEKGISVINYLLYHGDDYDPSSHLAYCNNHFKLLVNHNYPKLFCLNSCHTFG